MGMARSSRAMTGVDEAIARSRHPIPDPLGPHLPRRLPDRLRRCPRQPAVGRRAAQQRRFSHRYRPVHPPGPDPPGTRCHPAAGACRSGRRRPVRRLSRRVRAAEAHRPSALSAAARVVRQPRPVSPVRRTRFVAGGRGRGDRPRAALRLPCQCRCGRAAPALPGRHTHRLVPLLREPPPLVRHRQPFQVRPDRRPPPRPDPRFALRLLPGASGPGRYARPHHDLWPPLPRRGRRGPSDTP